MISFFANIFGYVLNFIYSFVNNYGLAIILFSILLKIVLIPLSISQQKTMKKSAEMQKKVKEIQHKYEGNQEKINKETMNLYKQEKMNPFSGCFTAIIQIVLLFSMFYLVRNPLTHMKKVDTQVIDGYINEIKEESPEGERNLTYPEISVVKQKGAEDERVYINMDFLGLDLSNVPTQQLTNWTVYIIPVLYVISSLVSMKITTNTTNKKKKEEITENAENKEKTELDAVDQANKSMMWFMPIMSVSISLVAPLGLALYWLVNNVLIIIERLCINKYLENKEEKENA